MGPTFSYTSFSGTMQREEEVLSGLRDAIIEDLRSSAKAAVDDLEAIVAREPTLIGNEHSSALNRIELLLVSPI